MSAASPFGWRTPLYRVQGAGEPRPPASAQREVLAEQEVGKGASGGVGGGMLWGCLPMSQEMHFPVVRWNRHLAACLSNPPPWVYLCCFLGCSFGLCSPFLLVIVVAGTSLFSAHQADGQNLLLLAARGWCGLMGMSWGPLPKDLVHMLLLLLTFPAGI